MKKEIYAAPSIELVEVAIEKGFAQSYPGGTTEDGGSIDYSNNE